MLKYRHIVLNLTLNKAPQQPGEQPQHTQLAKPPEAGVIPPLRLVAILDIMHGHGVRPALVEGVHPIPVQVAPPLYRLCHRVTLLVDVDAVTHIDAVVPDPGEIGRVRPHPFDWHEPYAATGAQQ